MDLTLNVYSDSPGFTVVAVGGEIDVYTAPKLREKLISLVESGSYQLIVDMEARRVPRLDRPRRARRRPEAGPRARRLDRPGVHAGPHPADLPDHRPQPGVQHLRLGAPRRSPPTPTPPAADDGERPRSKTGRIQPERRAPP